jgi:hypothetical protein
MIPSPQAIYTVSRPSSSFIIHCSSLPLTYTSPIAPHFGSGFPRFPRMDLIASFRKLKRAREALRPAVSRNVQGEASCGLRPHDPMGRATRGIRYLESVICVHLRITTIPGYAGAWAGLRLHTEDLPGFRLTRADSPVSMVPSNGGPLERVAFMQRTDTLNSGGVYFCCWGFSRDADDQSVVPTRTGAANKQVQEPGA